VVLQFRLSGIERLETFWWFPNDMVAKSTNKY
jgi:hypothetical protein